MWKKLLIAHPFPSDVFPLWLVMQSQITSIWKRWHKYKFMSGNLLEYNDLLFALPIVYGIPLCPNHKMYLVSFNELPLILHRRLGNVYQIIYFHGAWLVHCGITALLNACSKKNTEYSDVKTFVIITSKCDNLLLSK